MSRHGLSFDAALDDVESSIGGADVAAAVDSLRRAKPSPITPNQLFRLLDLWQRAPDAGLMPAIRDLFAYEPSAYFDCHEAPVTANLETGTSQRGYSVHMCIYQDSAADSKGALLRMMTADGVGIDFAVHHGGTLEVRVIPDEASWIMLTVLPPHWSTVTFVHVNLAKPQMHVYVNGGHAASVAVPYPTPEKWTGNPLLLMIGGGYTGRIATCGVFGDPLPHRSVSMLHAASANFRPHFHEQHSFTVMGIPATVTSAYPHGAGSKFPEIPRAYIPGHLTLYPRTLLYVAAAHVLANNNVDPLPFPRRTIDIVQGVTLHHRGNLQSAFESAGGLPAFLVMISPSFTGRKFITEDVASLVIELLADLLRGCLLFAIDLSVMGAVVIHNLIFQCIDATHRTRRLLNATRSLLTAIDQVDVTSAKHLFLDFFTTTLLDVPFWCNGDADCQAMLADMITALVSPNPSVFEQAIGVKGFIHHLDVVNRLLGNNDETISSLADCMLTCIELVGTPADSEVLLSMVMTTRNRPNLQLRLLSIVSKIALKDRVAFCALVVADQIMHFRALLELTNCQTEKISRLALRLVGIVLVSVQSTTVRSAMSKTAALFFERQLRLDVDVYCNIMQILVGQISTSEESTSIHDEHALQIPELLPALFGLMRACNDAELIQRILMDLLSLVKISDRNRMAFTRNPFWQNWVLPYILPDGPATGSVCAQIASQLLINSLLYCLMHEEKGWIAFDQTLWILDSDTHGSPKHTFDLKCAIILELVSQVYRLSSLNDSSSPVVSETLCSNLKPTFLLIEKIVFESPMSFVNAHEPSVTPDHLALLERLLIAALKYLPFPERRQHILRLVLRYLYTILPKPENVKICPVILGAASQVFGLLLGEKNVANIRVVQIAVAFLKMASNSLHTDQFDSSLDVERVIQSLVHVWGTDLFTDTTVVRAEAPGADDPDRVSLLGGNDNHDESDGVEHDGPITLTESQLADLATESFQKLREKFTLVLNNRCDKISNMLHDYRMRITQSVSERKMADLNAQAEFENRLAALSISNASSSSQPPPAILSMQQRSAYLMNRAVHNLKRFRDALAHSGDVEGNSSIFWKIDRTENSLRMRYLLRKNYSGHRHLNAASKPDLQASVSDDVKLPAIVGSGGSPTPDEAIEESTISSEDPQNYSATNDDDDEPIGFNIDRPGEPGDDTGTAPHTDDVLLEVPCTLITVSRKVDGVFTIGSDSLRFVGQQDHAAPGDAFAQQFQQAVQTDASASAEAPIESMSTTFKPRSHLWFLREIRQVLPRRYLLRECGMELFTKNYRSYFFTFDRTMRNKVYKQVCKLTKLPPELSNMRRLRYSGITDKWVNKQISNYEYLAHLNTIAGRSYNDLTQYPVFPAVIQDYKSEQLDLNNPETFRDLSKPIGALNPDRLPAFEAKYAEMVELADPAMPPFHYGSHYLSAGIVLYYLVRLEPFTTLNVQLQGGRFDLPDRMFNSVAGAWDLSMNNLGDVKELIPEFFYLSEFLTNHNDLPLGVKQDGSPVGDVVLPPWAHSPEHFVHLQRQALESDYVSANLHKWIDLIFGYKQRGQDAIDAKNVFFHLTYAGAVDIDSIADESIREATIAQIYHFGQTPSQLFDKPHPAQRTGDDVAHYVPPRAVLPMSPERTASVVAQLMIWPLQTPPRSTDRGQCDLVITRADILAQVYFDGDVMFRSKALTVVAAATVMGSQVPLRIRHQSGPVCLSRSGQLLFCGGAWDGSLECYLCPMGRLISRTYAGHNAAISCMHIDADQTYMVTGALDGTVCLWSVCLRRHSWSRPPVVSVATAPFVLKRTSAPVVCVSISASLGVLCSAHQDGTCALFSVRRVAHLRTFRLPDGGVPTIMHLTATGRIVAACGANVHLLTCNARFLRTIEWGSPVTCITSNKSGELIIIGGHSGQRITFHSYCELDLVQELPLTSSSPSDYASTGASPAAVDLSLKENAVAVAFSDHSVCVLPLPNSRPDSSLINASLGMMRDATVNTLNTLRDTLDAPIEATRDMLTDAVVQALDRGSGQVEAATSNLWSSFNKVKTKLFRHGKS